VALLNPDSEARPGAVVRARALPVAAELAAWVATFHDDPHGFVCACFRWLDAEAGLEGVEGPDVWQAAFLLELGRMLRAGVPVREAVSAGHGIGKGACAAFIILWLMCTRPHLAGVVTANTASQLKGKTWRELSIWHRRLLRPLAGWFEWTAKRFYHRAAPETWGVDAVCWSERNPEAFAGLHARDVLVIFDEASAIPDAIWEVTEGR
jgi:hypothetical protein